MRYLSVCSGIEAATVAWKNLGWKAEAYSEIEPFPASILARHYPETPNLGDITEYEKWKIGSIDILVGGTPCQSFSTAGGRDGMDDPRGRLALAFSGIAARFLPRWIVWENVPGVLSSNGGKDFAAFIESLVKFGYGLSWRVLDAQYFGVPQRRRRVFVIGHLGGWRSAAAVLFERKGLCWNNQEVRKKRKDSPKDTSSSSGISAIAFTAAEARRSGTIAGSRIAPTLTSQTKRGDTEPCVAISAPTLTASNDPSRSPQSSEITAQVEAVVRATSRGCFWDGSEVSQTIDSVVAKGQMMPEKNGFPVVLPNSIEPQVRRLTPRERERLQGFPDHYTLSKYDSPRYKALGNSMAVPVMRWIGERIQMVENIIMDKQVP